MALSVTTTIDKGRAAEQIRKRSARAIEQRGDRLGIDAVKTVQKLIDREMGPSTGRSEKRGLVSMRNMPFRHTVDSGGDFPIVVTLHNDVSGPSASKFLAIEFGSRGGEYIGDQRYSFPGGRPKDKGRNVVPVGGITRKATSGRFFMRRALNIATAGVYAGFQFTRSFPHAR